MCGAVLLNVLNLGVWQAMCGRYSEVCECVSLENLNESKNMFAEFEPIIPYAI